MPDCRAYELVTPSFGNGAIIIPQNAPNSPFATSPARIGFATSFTTFAGVLASNFTSDLFIGTRTDTGWQQQFIGKDSRETPEMGGPPFNYIAATAAGAPAAYSQQETQASQTLDRVIDYDRAWIGDQNGSAPGVRGTPSNAPYLWDGTSGSLLGRWPTNLAQTPHGEEFIGMPQASADFGHFVFSSNLVFSDNGEGEATEEPFICCSQSKVPAFRPKGSVYDNDLQTGNVRLASLKSDNVTQFQGYVFDLSDDGSHILMSEHTNPNSEMYNPPGYLYQYPKRFLPGPLYLRVNGVQTFEIAAGHTISYVGSTADGKTVYIKSSEQLTPDDQDSSIDLFVWRQSEPNNFTLVSAGSGGAGNTDACSASWISGCGVLVPYIWDHLEDKENSTQDGPIASQSGDIYFQSPEQLIAGKGEPDAANLYLYRQGSLRFVATLQPGSECSEGWCFKESIARMQINPDGSHMALLTTSNLTGYDSQGRREMYSYDPISGRVACASCSSSGQPPVGDVAASQNGLFQAYDGRVFFYSPDALVPRDTDEVGDVYEYTEGRAQLISAGLGAETPAFSGVAGSANGPGLIGVSANGTDAYFATIDTLVAQDNNGALLKIYDARSGGGFPAELPPPDCSAADECHGSGSASPALPPDRTSANLGSPQRSKAHKKKHAKAKKHRKRRAGKAKAKRRAGNNKQGGQKRG